MEYTLQHAGQNPTLPKTYSKRAFKGYDFIHLKHVRLSSI